MTNDRAASGTTRPGADYRLAALTWALCALLAAGVLSAVAAGGATADEAKAPRVLLIGDSISIYYHPFVKEMLAEAAALPREPIPASEILLATECGGSDYTSGLASNPTVGAASDLLVGAGGTVILSETTELIGAEHLLARRASTPDIGRQVLDLIAWWEKEAISTGQDIRGANPAPGNIAGGITTIEEKSLGCIYKGGTTTLEEVVKYAFPPTKKGLILMDTPGHDIDQLTGMMAGGAQIAVFTTGRGTPTGSPIAPVIKITGNADTCRKMKDNIDLCVSQVLQGKETVKEAGKRAFEEILAVASGKLTKAEKLGQRDFCIFKIGLNF
jgi:altronate dehydratase large subunit